MKPPWTFRVAVGGQPPEDLVANDGLSIGRHVDCDLTLNDQHVSAWHARVVARGSGLAIVDLGSNNGTLIDGSRILGKDEEQVLRSGMRIQLGHVEIEVIGPPAGGEQGPIGGNVATDLAIDDAPMTVAGQTMWSPKGAGSDALSDDMTTRASSQVQPPARPAAPSPPAAPIPPRAPSPSPEPPQQRPPQQRPPQQRPPEARPPVHAGPERNAPVPRDLGPPPAENGPGFGGLDDNELKTMVAHGGQDLGAAARLERMGARFVVVNEADLRVVPVEVPEFTVGRSASAHLSVGHIGVSQQHATLRFMTASNVFMLEDTGSSNGTQLAGSPLAAHSPRELASDMHVRFGTIDMVFMQRVDADFHSYPKSRYGDAAKLLVSRGKVSANVMRLATKTATERGQSLAEVLLLGQHVSPRDWCLAVEDARVASTMAALSGERAQRWILGVVVLALICAFALIFGAFD